MRWLRLWCYLIFGTPLILATVDLTLALTLFTLLPNRVSRLLVLWPPVSLIAFNYLARRTIRQLERQIRDDNCAWCLHCGYRLKGLPDKHVCPECGTDYDLSQTRRIWTAHLDAQKNL